MKEISLIYPDGTEATRDDVRRKLLFEKYKSPIQRTPFNPPRNFKEWQPIVERRREEYRELVEIPEHVEIEIPTKKPILVGLFGDVHALAPEVNLTKFANDVDYVKEAGGYFITVGDLTDSFFWKPEPALGSNQESQLYMQSALDYMAEDGHLLAGFIGDHEGWVYDKHGMHTLYQRFQERYNAHLLDGVSYIDLNLNNGENEVKYGLVGSHRHKGFSVYNDAHASLRQWRDEGIGSVISFTAHNHKKAYLQQVHKLHGGKEVIINALALGTYKESDRYSRKHGWPRKGEESQGAFGLVMYPGEERLRVFWEIKDAVEDIIHS